MSRDGKKIVRVVLEDFQSHAHSELRPAPSLTVIVDPSDAGKSAILRALRCVYTNQPSGDAPGRRQPSPRTGRAG